MDRNHSEMPIASCRDDGKGMKPKIEWIYISLSVSLSSSFRQTTNHSSSAMGRRKIEIQPITVRFLCFSLPPARPNQEIFFPQHERNRSVTFLKVSLLFPSLLPSLLTPSPPEEERLVQKGVRARRPLLRRRRRPRL